MDDTTKRRLAIEAHDAQWTPPEPYRGAWDPRLGAVWGGVNDTSAVVAVNALLRLLIPQCINEEATV